jgi:hypothetical protein
MTNTEKDLIMKKMTKITNKIYNKIHFPLEISTFLKFLKRLMKLKMKNSNGILINKLRNNYNIISSSLAINLKHSILTNTTMEF